MYFLQLVGEINIFMQSCCIISPATLIPIPVHKIANKRGSLDIINISHCLTSPLNRPETFISKTPTNNEAIDKIKRITIRQIVK